MKQETYDALFEHVINRVEGGICTSIMQMLDEAIEEGYIDAAEYRLHEMQILGIIDDHIFECCLCGWTQPVCQMGEDHHGQLACDECSPIDKENEDED